MKIKKYIKAIKKIVRVKKFSISIFIYRLFRPLPNMFKEPDLWEKAFVESVMRLFKPSKGDIKKATKKYNRGNALIESGADLPEDGVY